LKLDLKRRCGLPRREPLNSTAKRSATNWIKRSPMRRAGIWAFPKRWNHSPTSNASRTPRFLAALGEQPYGEFVLVTFSTRCSI